MNARDHHSFDTLIYIQSTAAASYIQQWCRTRCQPWWSTICLHSVQYLSSFTRLYVHLLSTLLPSFFAAGICVALEAGRVGARAMMLCALSERKEVVWQSVLVDDRIPAASRRPHHCHQLRKVKLREEKKSFLMMKNAPPAHSIIAQLVMRARTTVCFYLAVVLLPVVDEWWSRMKFYDYCRSAVLF